MNTPIKKSFAIRNATHKDCAGILKCLGLASAPYRESYTPEAFLDTVFDPADFSHPRCPCSLRSPRLVRLPVQRCTLFGSGTRLPGRKARAR
jgi:hypothetical protein